MKRFILAALVVTSSKSSFAQTGFKIEMPSFIGTGCDISNTFINISRDGQAITTLFENYRAEAGGTTGRMTATSNCNFTIPVQLEEGYALAVSHVDFAGFAQVPQSGAVKFKADFYIPGTDRLQVEKTITNAFDDSFIAGSSVTGEFWSECGKKVLLNVNTTMLLKSNTDGDSVMAGIDSADIEAGVVHKIKVKKCPDIQPQPEAQRLLLSNYISNVYSDSFATTLTPPSSYKLQEELGYVYATKVPNSIALKSCLSQNAEGLKDHFSNVNCGSGRELGVLGYIDVFGGLDNSPIYFCFSNRGNRFLARTSGCNGAASRPGVLIGYVKKNMF